MRPFTIPVLEDFAKLSNKDRIAALLPVAEFQAYRVAKRNGVHVDDYKSAGWAGLWTFCQEFDVSAYQDNGHFRSVVMRVARNSIIDERRRLVGRFSRGKWRGLALVDVTGIRNDLGFTVPAVDESMRDAADTPREALERAEMPNRAEALLSLLGERAEKVMRMIYFEGRSQVEVGRIMGCTGANISLMVKGALRKMRSQ